VSQSITPLVDKFRGCLIGAAVGDVVGAVVEAETPEFIAGAFRSVDDILAVETVPEFTGPDWRVGRFTDDTQMMLCVAEWLIDDVTRSPEGLLARFSEAYETWRRYGSGTAAILRLFDENRAEWRQLATAVYPWGSYGNGSAMRVAPVGLLYHDDPRKLADVAVASSRPTHSHPLAYQGAILQATAVATAASAATTIIATDDFLRPMRHVLHGFAEQLQDISKFSTALDAIESGLGRGSTCRDMSETLGTGIAAHQAVPMALYCFMRHPESYERVIHEAVFIGGDTDTIASMAGAISGAFLDEAAIPAGWRRAVREDQYPVERIERLADQLLAAHLRG